MLNQHITLDEPSPNDIGYYGTDPEGPTPLEEHELVEVNDVENPFTEGQFEEFQRLHLFQVEFRNIQRDFRPFQMIFRFVI